MEDQLCSNSNYVVITYANSKNIFITKLSMNILNVKNKQFKWQTKVIKREEKLLKLRIKCENALKTLRVIGRLFRRIWKVHTCRVSPVMQLTHSLNHYAEALKTQSSKTHISHNYLKPNLIIMIITFHSIQISSKNHHHQCKINFIQLHGWQVTISISDKYI